MKTENACLPRGGEGVGIPASWEKLLTNASSALRVGGMTPEKYKQQRRPFPGTVGKHPWSVQAINHSIIHYHSNSYQWPSLSHPRPQGLLGRPAKMSTVTEVLWFSARDPRARLREGFCMADSHKAVQPCDSPRPSKTDFVGLLSSGM